jgi:hypothetical protein
MKKQQQKPAPSKPTMPKLAPPPEPESERNGRIHLSAGEAWKLRDLIASADTAYQALTERRASVDNLLRAIVEEHGGNPELKWRLNTDNGLIALDPTGE